MLEIPIDNNYSSKLSFLIGQMVDTRKLLLKEVEGITQEMLDFSPDINNMETIGTLLFHIADVENSWMFEAVEGEDLDLATWKYAFPLRQQLNPRQQTGKPLSYYIDILDEVRNKVLTNLLNYNDNDLKKEYSNRFGNFNLEWVLYHNVQHESQHIGQINTLKRFLKHNIYQKMK